MVPYTQSVYANFADVFCVYTKAMQESEEKRIVTGQTNAKRNTI